MKTDPFAGIELPADFGAEPAMPSYVLESDYRDLQRENAALRDKLANARGWIMANTTKPVHDLLKTLEP